MSKFKTKTQKDKENQRPAALCPTGNKNGLYSVEVNKDAREEPGFISKSIDYLFLLSIVIAWIFLLWGFYLKNFDTRGFEQIFGKGAGYIFFCVFAIGLTSAYFTARGKRNPFGRQAN